MQPLPIPRITDVAAFAGYHEGGRPVVVEGLARSMPAFDWTDDYLVSAFGSTKPLVRLQDGRRARMTAADFFSYLADPAQYPSSLGPVYLTDFHVYPSYDDVNRERLGRDARCPLPLPGAFAEWISLYAGPPGTGSEMHQDIFSTHTWLAQLRGEKTWRLCPPDGLDPAAGETIDAFSGDDLGCDLYEAVLVAGDVIYLPPDWWHQVRNPTTASLALSGNFCTFEAARAHLAAVASSDASNALKQTHTDLWQVILATETTGT